MRRLLLFVPAALAAACATLGGESGGDDALPNASAGPFRAIVQAELGNSRVAPNAVEDDNHYLRDPSVLRLGSDPSSLDVVGFFGGVATMPGMFAKNTDPTNAIYTLHATDGRSFDRDAVIVLQPTHAWEGVTMGGPAALAVDGVTFLYYAAAGGIGLARSSDGATFTPEDAAVLAPATSGWDAGFTPSSPGVVRMSDGSFRMFYEANGAIGEARSSDGLVWTRAGDGPALAPAATTIAFDASASDAGDPNAFDDVAVGAPFPMVATSGDGRAILRVYYRGTNENGDKLVGLAARYGDDEPLARAASSVYGTSSPVDPDEPCVVDFGAFTLLFATQRSGTSIFTENTPAVGAGIAPATVTLPPATPSQ